MHMYLDYYHITTPLIGDNGGGKAYCPHSPNTTPNPLNWPTMNERRREQNRNAQRRFRERQQRLSADQSRAISLLQLSQQNNDSHHQIFTLDRIRSPYLTPPQDSPTGDSGLSLCDGSLYGSNSLLDNIGLLDIDQIYPQETGPRSIAPVTPPETSNMIITSVEPGPGSSDSHGSERRPPGLVSPLHIAAQKGRCSIAKTLLRHNADPNLKDGNGFTPLFHATIKGHEEMVCLLLEHGAHVECVDNQGRSVLHWAVTHRRRDELKTLLQHCGELRGLIDGYDREGRTPLHMAIDADFDAGVQMLLQSGANVHCKAQHFDEDDESMR